MALINLSYCNLALGGKRYDIVYNNVTHVIESGVFDDSSGCNTPTPEVIYQHKEGLVTYQVKPKNSAPYAQVVQVADQVCGITIFSIDTVNASTTETADGTATINALSGIGGTKEYSIDGLNWVASNVFTGLLAGTYRGYARHYFPGQKACVDFQDFAVGSDVVVCNLTLGNILVTADTGASNGSITIDTVNNVVKPVEYRLDAGAWQDDPVFTNLAAGSYDVQVRYKDQTSCIDTRTVTVFAVDCDLTIDAIVVTHEQTKFGDNGSIRIIASGSNAGIEYSINDGVSYQSEDTFTDLSPGEYLIRVRDEVGCIATALVEVKRFRLAYIDIPIAQTHRFVLDNTDRPNFDNRLFKDTRIPGVDPCEYYTLIEHADVTQVQFRSNYENNTLYIYDIDGVLTDTLTPVKKTSFTQYTDSSEAYAAPSETPTQTQIYFADGLQEYAEPGQLITLTDFAGLNGDYEIMAIQPGTLLADGFEVIIITATTAVPLSGTVSAIYDVEPYEVYESIINWAVYDSGKYYIVLEGTDDQFLDYRAPSEPIDIKDTHPDCVLIDYRNNENAYKLYYSTGLTNLIRVVAEFKWPTLGGERTVTEDSRNRAIKLAEDKTRNPSLFVPDIPPYLYEQIGLAFGHDHININDVRYQTTEDIEVEYFKNDPFCHVNAKLRQYDFVADNSDDQGDVDTPLNILELNNDLFEVNPA
ncbi:hypothetical protein JMN32_19870 [Fulvivirga sp. 29W222]|uniref:SprB repeat-containing protein n=1 Tax=Fulvivirga marina TaxID=2494733 RepID=A0A937KDL1_9BACT|nr:hypothetical protein [Fulvivirga marina]MBL6448579.1 hypothetical protein [Fulvivirga marina]